MSVAHACMRGMGIYHPWRDLRRRDIILTWHDHLPGGIHSATDGRRIVMARGLTQTQRRCALAHELVHIDMGHTRHMPPVVEKQVHRRTANRLITWEALVDTAVWATSIREWSRDLWVTPTVFHARIDALTSVERGMLARLVMHAQDDHGGQRAA